MKKIITFVIVLFVSISAIGSANSLTEQKDNKFIGTFKGFTNAYEFQFTDEKGETIIMNEISDEVEIDLYEDENIGKKFEVTWEEEIIDLYDDEGEPTGETQKVKRITALKEVKK